MNNNNEINEQIKKEKEYLEIFNQFINSDENSSFSKEQVKKIVEAIRYKDIINSQPKRKNIVIASKRISTKLLNIKSFVNFLLTYIFYVGFLILISSFIYQNLFDYNTSIFIIAFVLTLIDKIVKPFVFFIDLLSFTLHKIGLITLTIYSLIIYLVSNLLNKTNKLSFDKAILIAIIVLVLTFIIEFINKDAIFKTKYLEDLNEIGSEEDE